MNKQSWVMGQKDTGLIWHPSNDASASTYICARLRYWQNLVKSMGRSLQVRIVNYLSILSLESSLDAQNNWFMHTIKAFVLQKFTAFKFFIFLNLKM